MGSERGLLALRHMKNKPEGHVDVLTPYALTVLQERFTVLRAFQLWAAPETPVFVAPGGTALTPQWANRPLGRLASAAGVANRVTTHIIRKSCGTLIGLQNPKLAQEQLGISERVFNRHYNLPTLEGRLSRRDILPGNLSPTVQIPVVDGSKPPEGFEPSTC